MDILWDEVRLPRLISDLHALSGARVSLLSASGRVLCARGARAPHCKREGAPCEDCKAEAVRACAGSEGVRMLRCEAGADMVIAPIRSGRYPEPLAYLCASGFAAEPTHPAKRQRKDSPEERALCRLSSAGRGALAGALEALADYIGLKGLVQPAGESDLRRLERFLDEHYMEKLTLASISAQLHIGRTRLCALAKELSGGETLFSMIASRRIDAAKALLIGSDRPISAIAEAVGISDYNYFSKIFRAAVGVSPSRFRKRTRQELDTSV